MANADTVILDWTNICIDPPEVCKKESHKFLIIYVVEQLLEWGFSPHFKVLSLFEGSAVSFLLSIFISLVPLEQSLKTNSIGSQAPA